MNKLKIVFFIFVSLALIACSGKKATDMNAAGANGTGAYASGISSEGGFGEATDRVQNQVCAPCKQTYYFEFDQDVVHQEDVNSIKMQANYLVAHPKARVRLEGNTDERGSKEYNVALGWRRAKAVSKMLQQEGVAPKQIVMISYGEEKPAATGHDEDSWRLNRKVDLSYERK